MNKGSRQAGLGLVVALLTMGAAASGEPQVMLARYTAEAVREQPGYTPSARRGAAFFRQAFVAQAGLPSCTTCHTEDPAQAGRHAVTGKTIRPLARAANGERFGDPARVEKWFGRNCREVVGRDCTSAEKGDLLAYLTGAA